MAGQNERMRRLSDVQARLLERQDAINRLNQRYAKFGTRVVQVMMQYGSQPGGMRDLILKLPIRGAALGEDQQHEMVLRFLHENGVASFLSAVQPNAPLHTDPTPYRGREPETAPPVPATPAPTPWETPVEPQAPKSAPPTADGEWVYVDRRSGRERRRGRDRRGRVDIIYKNSRYGGERRKSGERRKRQIPPPWPRKPGN